MSNVKKWAIVVQASRLPRFLKSSRDGRTTVKRAAEELGGPGERREKEEIRSRACRPLQRFSYGSGGRPRVTASGVPWRSCAWPRSIVPRTDPRAPQVYWLTLALAEFSPATLLCFPASDSRRAAWVRTADASLQRRAKTPDGSPRLGRRRANRPPSPTASWSSRAAPVANDYASGPGGRLS